jgi:hypothetical protein
LEGENGMFDVTPERGINEASFLIRVKDPVNLDFEKVKGTHYLLHHFVELGEEISSI